MQSHYDLESSDFIWAMLRRSTRLSGVRKRQPKLEYSPFWFSLSKYFYGVFRKNQPYCHQSVDLCRKVLPTSLEWEFKPFFNLSQDRQAKQLDGNFYLQCLTPNLQPLLLRITFLITTFWVTRNFYLQSIFITRWVIRP